MQITFLIILGPNLVLLATLVALMVAANPATATATSATGCPSRSAGERLAQVAAVDGPRKLADIPSR